MTDHLPIVFKQSQKLIENQEFQFYGKKRILFIYAPIINLQKIILINLFWFGVGFVVPKAICNLILKKENEKSKAE
jgi:hypothetical protein